MPCRSVVRCRGRARLSAENSGRAATRLQPLRSQIRCQIQTDKATKNPTSSPVLLHSLPLHWLLLPYACLKISSPRLLHFDRFEERLEISFAEAATASALDDLEEYSRAILHRLRKNLQQLTFFVAGHAHTERVQFV